MNLPFSSSEQQAKIETIHNKLTETMIAALRAAHSAVTADPSDLESLARQRRGEEILGRLVTPPGPGCNERRPLPQGVQGDGAFVGKQTVRGNRHELIALVRYFSCFPGRQIHGIGPVRVRIAVNQVSIVDIDRIGQSTS